ncbi:hypothetical protein E9531_04030 [Lampropedia puyangensis]|uniref:IPTL-CTERM sorting domain-containing protein n=1 Tax=Lampropedia puyangensis TaxID=1330072 RepID=A0A4S8FC26_9BURK|nr:hypothetical protein [Lampropedia puyangensis]THU04561.1 hypothetical protein E9531_04030 [Lampropedia puyangensis]
MSSGQVEVARVLQIKAVVLGTLLAIAAGQAQAQTPLVVNVPATANIFYAGTEGLTPPSINCTALPNGLGDGTLPPIVDLPVGIRAFQLANRNTANIGYGMSGPQATTPDGVLNHTTVVRNPSGTFPGLQFDGRYGMLAAVFLDANEVLPGAVQSPVSVNVYTASDMNAAVVAQSLHQPFFVGDGSVVDFAQAGSGLPDGTELRQTFTVPAGATRIGFGLADAPGINGDNRCYMDNRGAINAQIAMAVTDDAGTVSAGVDSVAIADVRANDFLENGPPSAPRATLATEGSWPAGITLEPATGQVKVAASVAQGVYPALEYSLCDTNTQPSASCLVAQVNVTVTAQVIKLISVQPDTGTVSTVGGGTAVVNVRANDTLDGAPATASTTTLSQQSIWPTGIALSTVSGAVTVAAGTPAGIYPLSYLLCEADTAGQSTSNCQTGPITVTVTPADAMTVVAQADPASVTTEFTGEAIANVRANDSFDGATANASNTTLAKVGNWPAGLDLDVDSGAVSIATPLAVGVYSANYLLCESANDVNCVSATVTVRVTTPPAEPAQATPVPVDSKWALLGMGLGCALLAGLRRRKR